MTFNFNDTVIVALTPKGLQVLTDYYMDLAKGLTLKQSQAILASLETSLTHEGGIARWTAQLCDLMEVFQESGLPMSSFFLTFEAEMEPSWKDQQQVPQPEPQPPRMLPALAEFPEDCRADDVPGWLTSLKRPFPMASLVQYIDWIEDHGQNLSDVYVYLQGIDMNYYHFALVSLVEDIELSLYDSWSPERYADYMTYSAVVGMKVD